MVLCFMDVVLLWVLCGVFGIMCCDCEWEFDDFLFLLLVLDGSNVVVVVVV